MAPDAAIIFQTEELTLIISSFLPEASCQLLRPASRRGPFGPCSLAAMPRVRRVLHRRWALQRLFALLEVQLGKCGELSMVEARAVANLNADGRICLSPDKDLHYVVGASRGMIGFVWLHGREPSQQGLAQLGENGERQKPTLVDCLARSRRFAANLAALTEKLAQDRDPSPGWAAQVEPKPPRVLSRRFSVCPPKDLLVKELGQRTKAHHRAMGAKLAVEHWLGIVHGAEAARAALVRVFAAPSSGLIGGGKAGSRRQQLLRTHRPKDWTKKGQLTSSRLPPSRARRALRREAATEGRSIAEDRLVRVLVTRLLGRRASSIKNMRLQMEVRVRAALTYLLGRADGWLALEARPGPQVKIYFRKMRGMSSDALGHALHKEIAGLEQERRRHCAEAWHAFFDGNGCQ